MRFKCGPTRDEELAKEAAARARLDAPHSWHPWFAWFPIQLAQGDCRWLEVVERRGDYTSRFDNSPWWVWSYREIPS